MKCAEQSFDRLKDILKKDKENISVQLLNLIKTDLFQVLNGYFELGLKDISLTYHIKDNGKYHLSIDVLANNVRHNLFFINS